MPLPSARSVPGHCLSLGRNTDGKIDPAKLEPITYDPVNHTYRKLGDVVGKAFSDGKKLG